MQCVLLSFARLHEPVVVVAAAALARRKLTVRGRTFATEDGHGNTLCFQKFVAVANIGGFRLNVHVCGSSVLAAFLLSSLDSSNFDLVQLTIEVVDCSVPAPSQDSLVLSGLFVAYLLKDPEGYHSAFDPKGLLDSKFVMRFEIQVVDRRPLLQLLLELPSLYCDVHVQL